MNQQTNILEEQEFDLKRLFLAIENLENEYEFIKLVLDSFEFMKESVDYFFDSIQEYKEFVHDSPDVEQIISKDIQLREAFQISFLEAKRKLRKNKLWRFEKSRMELKEMENNTN